MSTKENNKPVQITELVLRDGHQSLFDIFILIKKPSNIIPN